MEAELVGWLAMDLFVIVYMLFLYLVVAPIFALAHELAHAVVALKCAQQRTTVRLGSRGFPLHLRLGQLTLDIRLGHDMVFGLYRLNGPRPVPLRRRLWITLSGPAVTLVFLLLTGGQSLWHDGPNPWLTSFAWINLVLLVNDLLPWHHADWMGVQAGTASDGHRILTIWQELRSKAHREGIRH